jgi:hypothetical protein
VLTGGGHFAEHLRLLQEVAADGLLGGEPSSAVPVHRYGVLESIGEFSFTMSQ